MGSRILLVELENEIEIHWSDVNSILDPWLNVVAFSPVDNIAVSFPSFEKTQDSVRKLSQLDLTESFTESQVIRDVSNIKDIRWNAATENFLVLVENENAIEFQDINGHVLIEIPVRILQNSDRSYYLTTNYAISSSGNYVALQQGSEIWVLECSE